MLVHNGLLNRNVFNLQDLNKAWLHLKQLATMRQDKLFGAHEIQRFNRDADETVAWITEKDVVLSSDDYGRDLATVQTLQVTCEPLKISLHFHKLDLLTVLYFFQRKHEGIERDLAALEHKVTTLGQEANRLCEIHSDHSEQITAKQEEIGKFWMSLADKAKVSSAWNFRAQ